MATVTGDRLQQKDGLCGPFQAARILRELGFDDWDGQPIDEDLLAARAGTILPVPAESLVPPGADSRTDYRHELATAPLAESGTAVPELTAVIERASGGSVRCVPIRGTWTAERVESLVERGAREARLLANVRTGHLWGSRPPLEVLAAELEGRESDGPPAEWDVGHFCELIGVLRGSGGSLIAVRDSYPSLGLCGYHLQPPRAVAAALDRGDRREGGVLAIAGGEAAAGVEQLAVELGLELGTWDNGTRR
jgi:hypothetical protein